MKLIISSNSSLMNLFTINCLHLTIDSSCKHLISDCLSITILIVCQYSILNTPWLRFHMFKQYFKSCSKMPILKFSL